MESDIRLNLEDCFPGQVDLKILNENSKKMNVWREILSDL